MSATTRPPAAWYPRGPLTDTYPFDPTDRLTAVTIFTTYRISPARRNDDGTYTLPVFGAVCACNDLWQGSGLESLRKILAGHRCSDHAPVVLVPLGADEPDESILSRLLDGLRAL